TAHTRTSLCQTMGLSAPFECVRSWSDKRPMQQLLLDTNVLILLVIGRWDRRQIPYHRRTRVFGEKDFDLLQEQIGHYAGIITTPGVLAETSNLMGNDFHDEIASTIIDTCTPFVELVSPKA